MMKEIEPERLPQHIAIIMDGNGRWAERHAMGRILGHRKGADSVRVAVQTCRRIGIKCLTLYAFSVENWLRPDAEVRALLKLLQELPGVTGKALYIPPLPFGVDRIKRERRFARAGKSRDHDKLIAGYLEVYVLEIVFFGAFDDDIILFHIWANLIICGPLTQATRNCGRSIKA